MTIFAVLMSIIIVALCAYAWYFAFSKRTLIYVDMSASMHCFRPKVEQVLHDLGRKHFLCAANASIVPFDHEVRDSVAYTKDNISRLMRDNNFFGGSQIGDVLARFSVLRDEGIAKKAFVITDDEFFDRPTAAQMEVVEIVKVL
jgi:hypothetical protein